MAIRRGRVSVASSSKQLRIDERNHGGDVGMCACSCFAELQGTSKVDVEAEIEEQMFAAREETDADVEGPGEPI